MSGLTFMLTRSVESSLWLDLDSHNASKRRFFQCLTHLGHQRPQIVNVVGRCNHYNDRKVYSGQILLILDTLVYCEKYIEFLSGTAE